VIADSVVTLNNSAAGLISTTSVKAEDAATIVAPDGSVEVNGVAFDDVVSGGTIDIPVVKSTGNDPVGSKQGTNWRIGDSTVNVNKSDGVLISARVVRAEETENYNVADSVIENSDSTYTANVKATDGLVLPDQQIEVNSVNEGSIPSVGGIDINITDGVNPVTPNSVGIVGRTVTVEVPSGGGSFDVDLVDRFGNAFPTRQVTANATWDLRTLTPFDWADLFLNTATGTYTTGEQNAIIDAVDSWFAAGIWQKRYTIHLYTGKNAFDNSLSLRYPFDDVNSGRLTFLGSPTHNSNGLTITAGSLAMLGMSPRNTLPNNLNIFHYSRTNNQNTGNGADWDANVFNVDRHYCIIRGSTSDTCQTALGGTIITNFTSANSDGGWHFNGGSGAGAGKVVRNGVSGTPLQTFTDAGNINNSRLFTMGGTISNINSIGNNSLRNYAGWAIGERLTDTQMTDDYNIWQIFQTDFNGRQV
jgi:hypothetical protein